MFLVLLTLLSAVQRASASPGRGEPWMYDHIFPGTDTPLLKRAIEESKEGKMALGTLLSHYKNMEERLNASVREDDYDQLQDTNVVNFLQLYGWPEMNKTQLIFSVPKPRNRKDAVRYRKERKKFVDSERRVFKAIIELGNALDSPIADQDIKRFTRSIADPNVTKWDHVFQYSQNNYTTEAGTHKCQLRSNLGLRVNGSWFVLVVVTSERPAAFMRQKERIDLREVYHFSSTSGKIEHLPFYFDFNYKPELKYWGERSYTKGDRDSFTRTPVSTLFSEFGGKAKVRFFITRPLKHNIAVRAALADSAVLTRQVQDSRVWSNTAILLFPLLLSLIPLALYADASNRMYFGYMLVTDFLAVLPLGIKGAELIAAGQREYFSTRTVVRGTPTSLHGTLVASTFSCRCTAAGNITALGATFIAISVVAAVTGVMLEFLVKHKVEANKFAALQSFQWTGDDPEYFWVRRGPCSEYDCDDPAHTESVGEYMTPAVGGLIGQIRQRRKAEKDNSANYLVLGTGL